MPYQRNQERGVMRSVPRAAGEDANPVGNTGLKLQTSIKADYLVLTAKLPDVQSVRKCIQKVAYEFNEDGGVVWTEDKGLSKGRYYAHSANTVHGTKFGWHPRQDGSFDVWVSIPGGVLSRVDSRLHFPIFKNLYSCYGFTPTRFDIALDDFGKTLPFETVVDALRFGNYVRFGQYDIHQNFGKKGGCGWTINFGSRKSDKYYRYYDKSAESNGEIDAYRLEVELKDFKAKQVWKLLMDFAGRGDEGFVFYQELLREVVIGGVDFRDLSADSNISRCPQLGWWVEFIEYVKSTGGIRLGSPTRISSLQKTVTWIKTQVETSLAMMRDVLGAEKFHDFIRDAIDSGRLRYDRHHMAMLQLHVYGYDELVICR